MFHAIFKTKGIFNSNRLSPPPFNLIKLDSLKKPLHKTHLWYPKAIFIESSFKEEAFLKTLQNKKHYNTKPESLELY